MAKRVSKYDFEHSLAVAARNRVPLIIDSINPSDLAVAIKNSPSLRGMILGYIAEVQFEQQVLRKIPQLSRIKEFDDHNRAENKADRAFTYKGREILVQLKSIQTTSIKWVKTENCLIADVQNDGSDKRDVKLPNGNIVSTTNYKIGDYDILAVPLFPYTQNWDFAYKLNRNCRFTTSKKYTEEDSQYLLATTEKLKYPLTDDWSTDLLAVCELLV